MHCFAQKAMGYALEFINMHYHINSLSNLGTHQLRLLAGEF